MLYFTQLLRVSGTALPLVVTSLSNEILIRFETIGSGALNGPLFLRSAVVGRAPVRSFIRQVSAARIQRFSATAPQRSRILQSSADRVRLATTQTRSHDFLPLIWCWRPFCRLWRLLSRRLIGWAGTRIRQRQTAT